MKQEKTKLRFKLIIYVLCLIIVFSFSSCYLIHIARWGNADMTDYRKFPYKDIEASAKPFRFYEGKRINLSGFNLPVSICMYNKFEDLVLKTKTLSFVIIRNDSVIYKYFKTGYNDKSVFPSYSVSKSFVSALLGIAIDEGKIKGVNQPITDYLEELKGEGFRKITIAHLLDMKTGIEYSENYSSPFSDVVKYYYGTDLKMYVSRLKIKGEPGVKYEYVSVSSQLLAMIIEKATGKELTEYLEEKIWQPLGMEYEATWSIDSKKHKTVKAFCCLNAHTMDFAKLGRLYLNKGNWNGMQVVSREWIEKTLAYSKDSTSNFYYQYQWRIGKKGDYFAKGALGQYIYVNPLRKIIIVRNGNEYGISNWEYVLRYISERI
jgi:CubicO group peptidase (beta-lactamase class C family)